MKYRIRFRKMTTSARLRKEIFCAGKRGIWRVGMSTSFPLKYPLSAKNSRGNRCRERAADAAECRCLLAAAAAREMWNCDGPPSCPFDQTYLPQIEIYISRHSIPSSSSLQRLLPLHPLTLPTRRLPIPRQRPHEILRADDAIPPHI